MHSFMQNCFCTENIPSILWKHVTKEPIHVNNIQNESKFDIEKTSTTTTKQPAHGGRKSTKK